MSERIDHAAEAAKHIEWAHNQQAEQGEFDFTVRDNALIAQVHATLALVEQQRIANLLRVQESLSSNGNYELASELWIDQIKEALWDYE